MSAELEFWDGSSSTFELASRMVSAYSAYIDAFSALAVEMGMSRQHLDAYTAERFEKYVSIVWEYNNTATMQCKPHERIISRCVQMSKRHGIPPINF